MITYFSALVAFLIFSIVLFRFVWNRKSRLRAVLLNVSICLFALAAVVGALEAVFSSWVAISDGFGFTLAAKKWREAYWKPVNSLGYRDKEHRWEEGAGKRILFVVGDSFVAGHGIKNAEDRLSDVLARKLGDRWEVVLLAQPGWQTDREYEALVQYPVKPDRIIVSYCLNDIYSAAVREGMPLPELIQEPHPAIRPLVEHSYLVNFVYWRVYRSLKSLNPRYWEYLKGVYGTEKVWEAHTKEISSILKYASDAKADILFLIWPNLRNPSSSADITEKVAHFVTDSGAQVLNLTPLLRDHSPGDLVVNSMDAHPNERVNAEVAELVYEKMKPWETTPR